MREVKADLWELPGDARVITTNGTITTGRRGVMGRGCALQAKLRYLGLAQTLGRYLMAHGNHVGVLLERSEEVSMPLVVFPVKPQWHDKAEYPLIWRSCEELVALTDARGWQTVLLPRPGCGNGRLPWEQVRDSIAPRLDDRFVIVERGTTSRWQA